MKTFTILVFFLSLCALGVNAQTIEVSGRITDSSGTPLQGASITIKGSKTGTSTAPDGTFKINAPQTGTLLISSVGLATREVDIQKRTFIEVKLSQSTRALDEVVVTALGIRRNRNTLPYAAQTVSGEDVSRARTNNFVNQLSGKVSGVEIRQNNVMGGSTNVVIRGNKSLLGNNQAMFVVDGVPVDNSNTSSAAAATGRATDVNSRNMPGTYDYGNAAADINPDDIESITVLKGAAATALYGSRAANGVIMITSKRGRRGLGITVNSGVTVGKIDKTTFAKYQKEYGGGYHLGGYSTTASGTPNTSFWYLDAFGTGAKSLIVPTTEDAAYGARFDPNLMVYHWDAFDFTSPYYKQMKPWVAAENDPTTFYETAVSLNNSVLLSGGGDKGNFKLGYTRTDETGILPNSKIIKNLINFGSNYSITEKLVVAAAVNFSRVDGKGRYGNGYTKYNVNQTFRQWWQPNVDVQELKDAYFRSKKNMTWNWFDPTTVTGIRPIYADNPYWMRYENYQTDYRYRTFGNVSLTYAPTSWLNILGRVSLDTYDELHMERVAVGSVGVPTYAQLNRTFREYNYDLMVNFDKNLTKDINLKAVVGTNIRRNDIEGLYSMTNGGLVVPKLYALSNSINPLNVLPTDETSEQVAVDGYFAGITLGYKDYLTLDATGRRDRSSTLPENNNAYFYPSVSASFLFSKLLPTTNWLTSGKIRANYAEVGNSAPFGYLQDIYFKPAGFGSTTLYSLPDQKNNAELKPERTRSKEVGLEMSFLRSRLGFDVTYYDTKSVDQILPVPISTATGYSFKVVNAGAIQNKGIELSLYATPLKSNNFSWNVNVNWTRNRNKVLELYGQSQNLQINPLSLQGGVSINATLGQPYGTIQGKTWSMIDESGKTVAWDGSREKLVGANGLYVMTTSTNNVIGNVNPNWIGGINNTFRYKNLSLGFLVDVRKGGDVFSLDLYYGLASGIYPETAGNNDLGNPKRSPLSQGGGIIYPGVTADGKPNTKRVDITSSGAYGYSNNPQANFVYDASFVKLREVNLTYSLPETLVGKIAPFKGIDLSLIGRNLWIIHKNLPYADPEENLTSGNIQGYQSGAYPTTRTIGVNLKLRF